MNKILATFVLFVIALSSFAQLNNKIDLLKVNDLSAKKFKVESTTEGAIPCPKMTLVQRDAIVSPAEGQCVYNSTAQTLNIYNGSAWVEVAGGGDGGISNWEAAKFYEIDSVVIYLDKIYQANVQHTSTGSFEPAKWDLISGTDLSDASGSLDATKIGTGSVDSTEFGYLDNASSNIQTQLNGKEPTISVLPLSKGGSNKSATASAGSVVYSDADSFELSSVGTAGQYLQSNGTSAPTWSSVSVNDAGFSGVLSLGKGGTSKALAANNGAVAYSDADSLELLAPGTSGQILQSNGAGAPSFVNKSISGKASNASAVTLEEIQVPNNQLTETGTNKHLIETGNSNLLVNPSFEHPTVTPSTFGWSIPAGTKAASSSAVNGSKSIQITLANETLAANQDSLINAAQFADGVQGLASIRVKTSLAGIRVCPRKAGSVETSLCVTHSGSGRWELLKVPFILGGVSNGISVNSTANVTGTVLLDDAFVGAVDLKVDGQGPQISALVSMTTNQSLTSGVETTIQFNFEQRDTNNAFDPSTFRFTAPETGEYQLSAFAYTNGTVTFNTLGFRVDGGGTITLSSSTGPGVSGSRTIFLNRGQWVDFRITSTGSSMALQSNPFWTTATINRVSTSSTYSSNNADTDWASCQFSTLAWQGLGTVSAVDLKCKRQGSDLLMRGRVTTGTVSPAEGRIPLPTWNGANITVANSSRASAFGFYGNLIRNSAGGNAVKDYILLSGANYAYLNIGYREYAIATSPFAALSGTASFNSGEVIDFDTRIPIEQFENSNIIIGQFNGLESCKDSYECTDTFTAYVTSTGTVVNENLDWITGNGTVASPTTTLTIKSGVFTVQPNCQATGVNNTEIRLISLSPTMAQVQQYSSAGANQTGDFMISCSKQGADYIGKTAKAVFQTGALYSSPTVLNQGSTGANTFETGFYTPTNIGSNLNVTSLNLSYDGQFKFMRVGNMLFVSGSYLHNISNPSSFGYTISLPSFVTNAFTNASDCSGTAVGGNSGTGAIRAGTVFANLNGFRVGSGITDTGGVVIMNVHAMCSLR
jgi:hypothetical protein